MAGPRASSSDPCDSCQGCRSHNFGTTGLFSPRLSTSDRSLFLVPTYRCRCRLTERYTPGVCSSQLHFTHAFPDPFPHSPRRPLAHPRTLHPLAPFSLHKSDPAVVCHLAPCFSILEHNHCRRLLRRPLPPLPQWLAQQRVVTICRVIMWDLLVGLQRYLQAYLLNLLSPRPCVTASVKIRWMVLPCRRLCSGRCRWAMW